MEEKKETSNKSLNMETNPSTTVPLMVKKTPVLCSYDSLENEGFDFLGDNSYIHTGYRVHYTFYECCTSIFQLHNESLNVWSHVLGASIFLMLLVALLTEELLVTSHSMHCPLATIPYMIHGRHTVRTLVHQVLPAYDNCDLHANNLQHGYDVAHLLIDTSLSRIPALEKLHELVQSQTLYISDTLSSKSKDVSSALGGQLETIRDELYELRGGITYLRDSGVQWLSTSHNIQALKNSLHDRIESFHHYVQHVAIQGGSDASLQIALDEYKAFSNSIRNGLHAISFTDNPILTVTHQVSNWPIVVFIICALICLISSSLFHLLYVHSTTLFYFMSRVDYAGIAVMIAGSFFPVIYYSFYCHPRVLNGYLLAITVMATATFIVSLVPAFGSAKFLVLRTSIFSAFGGFGVVPLAHLVWKYGAYDPHVTTFLFPLLLMGSLYILGAIIYVTKFPECVYPGRFDVYFSSHTLWHICVVLAALVHYYNAMDQLNWRVDTEC